MKMMEGLLMTNRERVNAILHYQPYDRIPVVSFGYWAETLDKWANEGYITREEAEGYCRTGDGGEAEFPGFFHNGPGGVGAVGGGGVNVQIDDFHACFLFFQKIASIIAGLRRRHNRLPAKKAGGARLHGFPAAFTFFWTKEGYGCKIFA